jgi:AAA+ ATPase superfamily predicted ATPase
MRFNAGGLSDLIIARDKEILTLKSYIEFSQNVVIAAPRRYGKTTLVNKVLDDLKSDYLIVKVDIFEATNTQELCQNYLNSIYQSIGIVNFTNQIKNSVFDLLDTFKLSYQQDGIKLGYEISKQKDDKLITQTFNFAEKFASLFNKKMLVFFDEFGDSAKFGEDFLKKIRSVMQKHKRVVYIFAGSQTAVMNNIFLNQNNAFFNFASLMDIGFLDVKQCNDFLTNQQMFAKLTPKVIKKLQQLTKFHPFYLIKTLQEMHIICKIENLKMDINTLDLAIKKILIDNNAYFESVWHTINNKKYQGSIFKSLCLKSDVSIKINPSYKSQIIKLLKEKSFINSQKQATDPFLCLWINDDF